MTIIDVLDVALSLGILALVIFLFVSGRIVSTANVKKIAEIIKRIEK